MRERSDEKLMKAWAGGDIAAFEQLYERHRAPLYRYLLRLAGDAATANDLYQGSWEKVIRSRRRYRASTPFRPWLYRIAHNHAVDHFRRLRPTAEVPVESLRDEREGPDHEIATDDERRRLAAAIQGLPPEQKDVVLLKLEAGLDLESIASVTGVKRETAKSRLRYALKKLQSCLQERAGNGTEP
jgi:RNA polymerase sigma-70 factor (ECF subfamily)